MKRLLISLPLLLLGGCVVKPTTNVPQPIVRSGNSITVTQTVAAGHLIELSKIFDLNPDCTVSGYAQVSVDAAPVHGTVTVQQGDFYPNYPSINQRYACNLKPHGGVRTTYNPTPGYLGPDNLTLDIVLPSGVRRTETFHLTLQ